MAELETTSSLQDYVALRAYMGSDTDIWITTPGLAGAFHRDDSDTTTPDDGGSVIVDIAGRRWKRQFSGAVIVEWFGAKGDGSTNNSPAIIAAINALPDTGGVIFIPLAKLPYKINTPITITKNHLEIQCETGTVIDMTSITTGFGIQCVGSFESELAIGADVTSGDTLITSKTVNNFANYDWILLKSQRCALHEDAGPYWRLGETTGSTTSTYFAEPVQVKDVTSTTAFISQSPVIFPDYRTNNELETSPDARANATVQKINFIYDFRFVNGKIISRGIDAIRFSACFRPAVINTEFHLGLDPGHAVLAQDCYGSEVNASAYHDTGLVDIIDHSEYNSFKEQGCWYSIWNVKDTNGMQGTDITWSPGKHPSIHPIISGGSYNNVENGLTFHSGCYGGLVNNFHVVNAKSRGMFIRSPFVSVVDSTIIGGNQGLNFQAWGGHFGQVSNLTVRNSNSGVYVERSGATKDGPVLRGILLSNLAFSNCLYGIYLTGTSEVSATAEPSGISVANIKGNYMKGPTVLVDKYINGVDITNITSGPITASTPQSVLRFVGDSVDSYVSNVRGNNIGNLHTLLILGGITDRATFPALKYPGPSIHVDTNTLFLTGDGHISTYTSQAVTAIPSGSYTLNRYDAVGPIQAGSGIATTVTVPPDVFPVQTIVEIAQVGVGIVTIVGASGVTVNSKDGFRTNGQYSTIKLWQRAQNSWLLSGDTQI